MKINFETITERDMDLFLMRKLSYDAEFLKKHFLEQIGIADKDVSVESIDHSVSSEDGESDIEVILKDASGKKTALLIEDKINAPAMENQAGRYNVRGDKAKEKGNYQEFHVFIVAPQRYLDGNKEAEKYQNKISYETIREELTDPFEKAVLDRALEISKRGYFVNYNERVTNFWNKVYDFADANYPGLFNIDGKRGLERSGAPGQWITIRCNNQFEVEIKSDRGYADLEVKRYGDKFEQFCKDNRDLIDRKRLYIRSASKSLAIRKYIDCIDFSQEFETQENALRIAFDAAKELQELIKDIKVR